MKLIKIKTYNIKYLEVRNIYKIEGTKDIYLNPDYIVTIEDMNIITEGNKEELYSVKLRNKETINVNKDTLGEILNNTDNRGISYKDNKEYKYRM